MSVTALFVACGLPSMREPALPCIWWSSSKLIYHDQRLILRLLPLLPGQHCSSLTPRHDLHRASVVLASFSSSCFLFSSVHLPRSLSSKHPFHSQASSTLPPPQSSRLNPSLNPPTSATTSKSPPPNNSPPSPSPATSNPYSGSPDRPPNTWLPPDWAPSCRPCSSMCGRGPARRGRGPSRSFGWSSRRGRGG